MTTQLCLPEFYYEPDVMELVQECPARGPICSLAVGFLIVLGVSKPKLWWLVLPSPDFHISLYNGGPK